MAVKIDPIPHLSADDSAELLRMLMLFARGDETAAGEWLLKGDVYDLGGKPIDLVMRDEIGVVMVLDYLRNNAP